jgi:hypothetical protein
VLTGIASNGTLVYQLDVGPSLGGAVNSSTVPVLGIAGASTVWNDARHILLSGDEGQVAWKNFFAEATVHGDFFSASITAGSAAAPGELLAIAMRNGYFFAYTTSGIPVAAIYLGNDTGALAATHRPVAAPVSGGVRVFVVAEAVDAEARARGGGGAKSGRLYGFDVRDADVDRIHQAWYVDFPRPSSFSFSSSSSSTSSASSASASASWLKPEFAVLVADRWVVALGADAAKGGRPCLVVFDGVMGDDASAISTKTVPGLALSATPGDVQIVADIEGTGVWVICSTITSRNSGPTLHHVDLAQAKVDAAVVDLGAVVGDSSVTITSRLVGAAGTEAVVGTVGTAGANRVEKGEPTSLDPAASALTASPLVLLFGAVVHGASHVLAVRLPTRAGGAGGKMENISGGANLLWKWKVPGGAVGGQNALDNVVTGQIAVIMDAANVGQIAVVRTNAGLFGLKLCSA